MILLAGERLIGSEDIPRAISSANPNPVAGRLYLTNFRLVFEALVEEASVGYVPKTVLELYLSQVSNVNSILKPKNAHLLRVESGPYWVYTFTTPNAQNWMSAIVAARSSHQAALAASHQAARSKESAAVPQTQHNPSQPLVFLHCTHCGSLNPAGSFHCGSCGARL